MSERPVNAECRELATVLRVYPNGKLPRLNVPIRDFAQRQWIKEVQRAAKGAEVVVKDGRVTCEGRIVSLIAVIELDRDTERVGPLPGQGTLA